MNTLVKGKIYRLVSTYQAVYIIEYLESTLNGVRCSRYRYKNDYMNYQGLFGYTDIATIEETDEQLNPNIVPLSQIVYGGKFKHKDKIYTRLDSYLDDNSCLVPVFTEEFKLYYIRINTLVERMETE